MESNFMLCLAVLSGLFFLVVLLWSACHCIKMRAYGQMATGITFGLVSAVMGGWSHPLALLLFSILGIGSIHAIAERIRELS